MPHANLSYIAPVVSKRQPSCGFQDGRGPHFAVPSSARLLAAPPRGPIGAPDSWEHGVHVRGVRAPKRPSTCSLIRAPFHHSARSICAYQFLPSRISEVPVFCNPGVCLIESSPRLPDTTHFHKYNCIILYGGIIPKPCRFHEPSCTISRS